MATFNIFNSLREQLRSPASILTQRVQCSDRDLVARNRALRSLMDSYWENHPDHGQSDT